MKRVVDEQGLTLIEAAVVLVIVSMLFLLPTITFQSYEEKIEVDLFIEEVRNNVTLMQNHAVFNGQATEIQVRAENNTIDFFVQGQPNHSLNRTITPPESIIVLTSNRYRFRAYSGNIGRLGRARFQVPDGVYEFVFQLGSGRFYVQKV